MKISIKELDQDWEFIEREYPPQKQALSGQSMMVERKQFEIKRAIGHYTRGLATKEDLRFIRSHSSIKVTREDFENARQLEATITIAALDRIFSQSKTTTPISGIVR
ncbi:MAG: hypothetical protein WCL07_01790 [bacterium]